MKNFNSQNKQYINIRSIPLSGFVLYAANFSCKNHEVQIFPLKTADLWNYFPEKTGTPFVIDKARRKTGA